MRTVIELKENEFKKGDILIWDGNSWISVTKESYLASTIKQIQNLEKSFEELKSYYQGEFASLKQLLELMMTQINILKEDVKILKGEE